MPKHLPLSLVLTISFIYLLSFRHLTALANNLPLLMGSLRTYQVNACDSEDIHLECDDRTVISIVVVQYGQPTPHKYMCKNFFKNNIEDDDSTLEISGRTASKRLRANLTTRTPSSPPDSRKCTNAEAKRLQYLFLLAMESTCREKKSCSLKVTPQSIGISVDPCAEHTKFAEVAYKCRPNHFINKVTCEGASLKLACTEHDRIVIFSAFYGATAQEVPECPQPRKGSLSSDCGVNYANEIVMSTCHGKRTCLVDASNATFGLPTCGPNRPASVRYYLKVVYTCMSKKMLKPEIIDGTTTTTTTTSTTTISISTSTTTMTSPVSRDTPTSITETQLVDRESTVSTTNSIHTASIDKQHRQEEDKKWAREHNNKADDKFEPNTHPLMDSVHSVVHIRSPAAGTDAHPHNHVNCSELPPSMQVIGFVSEWISAVSFLKKNKERFILYLLVSLFASLVCFLAVLSAKLYHQKVSTLRKVREEQAPVTPFEIMDFDDDLDDLDAMQSAGPMDSGGGGGVYGMTTHHHRHYSYHVPQDTPSVSILVPNTTEPRPLLYSTLRKKPIIKNQYSTVSAGEPWNTAGSRTSTSKLVQTQSPSITEYQSPLATLPKSILTNRNSVSSGILRPFTVEASTNTNGDTTGYNSRSTNGYSTIHHRPPDEDLILIQETTTNEDPHTQPKVLSKSLNNFFM